MSIDYFHRSLTRLHQLQPLPERIFTSYAITKDIKYEIESPKIKSDGFFVI